MAAVRALAAEKRARGNAAAQVVNDRGAWNDSDGSPLSDPDAIDSDALDSNDEDHVFKTNTKGKGKGKSKAKIEVTLADTSKPRLMTAAELKAMRREEKRKRREARRGLAEPAVKKDEREMMKLLGRKLTIVRSTCFSFLSTSSHMSGPF